MNLNKYIRSISVDKMGLHMTLINDKTYLVNSNQDGLHFLRKDIKALEESSHKTIKEWLVAQVEESKLYDRFEEVTDISEWDENVKIEK